MKCDDKVLSILHEQAVLTERTDSMKYVIWDAATEYSSTSEHLTLVNTEQPQEPLRDEERLLHHIEGQIQILHLLQLQRNVHKTHYSFVCPRLSPRDRAIVAKMELRIL